MESVKINTLELENVKRIRAVAMEPSPTGLTVIGGDNNQGKTSVLDTIAWALGGDRYKPTNATRDGSAIPPRIKITLSNGLIVERSGKNSALKVTDPNGRKSGQQLLNSFVEELALNLPKFMESPDREKANTLLQIIGVGDQLRELERKETEVYNRRRVVGQEADRKKKFALEMPFYQTNYRINSSNATNENASNMCTSGFIPVKAGDVVRIKNAVLVGGGSTPYFQTYTSTGGHMAANDPSVLGTADANGVYTWTAADSSDGTTKIGAFRLSVCEINANTIITVNEEIV